MAPLKIESFIFPKILKFSLIFCACILFTIYFLYQGRFLFGGPQISWLETPEVRQSDRVLEVSGTAKNITSLRLNDRTIFTDEAGIFKEKIVLEEGFSLIALEATDRYGRKSKISQPVYLELNSL